MYDINNLNCSLYYYDVDLNARNEFLQVLLHAVRQEDYKADNNTLMKDHESDRQSLIQKIKDILKLPLSAGTSKMVGLNLWLSDWEFKHACRALCINVHIWIYTSIFNCYSINYPLTPEEYE